MSDTFSLSNFTGLTENGAASTGSTLSTGDLRRRYNFGDMVSELRIAQDPYFRFLSKLRKQATDDPQFKFTEERPIFHKRYGYVTAHGTTSAVSTSGDATVTASNIAQGDTYYWKLGTDYKNDGNIGSRYGQATGEVTIGDAGTKPNFVIPGLILKIPFGSAYNSGVKDYVLARVEEVTDVSTTHVIAKTTIIRTLKTATNNELQWKSASAPMDETYTYKNAAGRLDHLESKKTYVVGNAFGKGTGYPETWADNPYSTGYGLTQIWKTALGMDNTTRATVLKYAGNEWARIWANKLIEHKWDIETDLLFGSQYTDANGIQYTQGLVDYIVNYGTLFGSFDHDNKTCDDFLNDMSQFFDPRYNNSASTLFMCDTYTFNWLNQLSGYFNNNIQLSPNYRADFSFKGTSNMLGVPVNTISTIYGDMNIARNVHLDNSGVYILGVNLNYVKYRPLVGNGLNRDTAVYVGVQTLENSGVDKRVDLILTEAGVEYQMPECQVAWTA